MRDRSLSGNPTAIHAGSSARWASSQSVRPYVHLGLMVLLLLLWTSAAVAASPEALFYKAESCYGSLKKHPAKLKYRHNWLKCINTFYRVYSQNPNGEWAAAGLYKAGRLTADLYRYSGQSGDRRKAADLLTRITKRYPQSRYHARAKATLAKLGVSTKTKKKSTPLASIPAGASYSTAGKLFERAESAHRELKKSSRKQGHRDQWRRVIDKYMAAYQTDPNGEVAPAALYAAGRLYLDLAQRSGLSADRAEGRDLLERIRKRHQDTTYAAEANRLLGAKPSDVEAAFFTADNALTKLMADKRKRRYRDQWMKVIEALDRVKRMDPQGPWAAAALYKSAMAYERLYRFSKRKADAAQAKTLIRRIETDHPKSDYLARAKGLRDRLPAAVPATSPAPTDLIAATIAKGADPDSSAVAKSRVGEEGTATVAGIRYWSTPSYTRVVIDADKSVDFRYRLLKPDAGLKKPPRLYVDLKGARLGSAVQKSIPIDDHLLTSARAGQYQNDVVRVVVDIKSLDRHNIFTLHNPFRIVIDVHGKGSDTVANTKPSVNRNAGALARQLSLGVRKIVIDPGHGGKDYGAPGYLKGVHEKQITLALSKRLAKQIKARLNCEVVLTRRSDTYLTLEERTAIANTQNADLFISIHTNAARDRRARGIETYILNLATDDEAIRVAARENATSKRNISDLQSILSQLMQNAKSEESIRLAGQIQQRMIRQMRKKYRGIRNKGVKQAPFYVLIGAQMPSVLIETAFISNKEECRRLVNPTYQTRLCNAIVDGIQEYIKDTNPMAFQESVQTPATGG